jgi:hypothetical protein
MKTDTTILSYPILGNCPGFTPQVYVQVDSEALQKKIDMLHKYESQVVRRGYFKSDAIKGWMAYCGIHMGVPYAEAFVPEKTVIKSFMRI